jgi:hypothetical protein
MMNRPKHGLPPVWNPDPQQPYCPRPMSRRTKSILLAVGIALVVLVIVMFIMAAINVGNGLKLLS